jgi:hypothetical protein
VLPAGWSASLQLAIDRARVHAGQLLELQGTLDLRQLQLRASRTAFGSYELVFPPRAASADPAALPMQGTLRDLEGPLSLRGQMRLAPQGSYELSGTVAAHQDASAELQQLLELLGPAGADGTREFSFSGTL